MLCTDLGVLEPHDVEARVAANREMAPDEWQIINISFFWKKELVDLSFGH